MATTETDLSRDQLLVRSAKVRALVTAKLSDGQDHEASELINELRGELDALGFNPENLRFTLKHMADNNLIRMSKRGRINVYKLRTANRSDKARPEHETEAKPDELPVSKLAKGWTKQPKPSLKVDLVKATGRVRLEIEGLIIEIGVV